MKTKISNQIFKNPIWVASGTFGYAKEFENFVNFKNIGAIVTKTVTLNAKEGNLPPRIVETASGMLNSIGLENEGAKIFKQKNYKYLKQIPTKIIISIAGESQEEFIKCVQILCEKDFPHAIELNLSCPNVKHGKTKYKLTAQDENSVREIVSAVKNTTKLPVIAKLSPNVTDIVAIAKVAEDGGADAVALGNTFSGIAIDAENMKYLLGNIIGGLSGPAIKPLALRNVWEVYKNISIPIIGIGGIMSGIDVAEFMLCGASAVQIGTANFINPDACNEILKEFKDYLKRKNIDNIDTLIGKLKYTLRK